MKNVWIVEDEPDIAELVAHNLRKEQFKVKIFHDGESFLSSLGDNLPDLLILDLILPGIDGLEICKMVRSYEETASMPIIMLTAKGEESDVVLGLELGADDYIVKPFSVRELVARVKTVLRRVESPQENEVITVEGLSVDLDGFETKVDNQPVDLTYAEFKMLSLLISKPGRVFTRQQIIDGIWEEGKVVTLKTVDVHVANLRKKIGRYGDFIKSVRGVGYKFET